MKKRITAAFAGAMALVGLLSGCTMGTPNTTPTPMVTSTPKATAVPLPTPAAEVTPTAKPEAEATPSTDAEMTPAPDAVTTPAPTGDAAVPDANNDFDTMNMDILSNGNIARAVERIKNALVPGMIQSDKISDLMGEDAAGFLGSYVSLKGKVKTVEDATEAMQADASILEEKGKRITLAVDEDMAHVFYIGKDTVREGDEVTVYGYFAGSGSEGGKDTVTMVSDRIEVGQE